MIDARQKFAVAEDAAIAAFCLIVMAALIAKIYVATRVLYTPQTDVRDVLFGFPGYVRSLLESGIYRACTDVPFDAIERGTCAYTSRMPALPLLLVGLSHLVGTKMKAVAIAKAVLMSASVLLCLWIWARNTVITPTMIAIVGFCLLGPQVIKHASCNDYEEGLLVEWMACHAILFSLVLARPKNWTIRETSVACASLVVLAGLCYLTKTTLLPFLIVTTAFAAVQLRCRRSLSCLMVLLGILPLIAWGSFSLASTGRWSLSSSWNGENLLRGFNSESYQIYPDIGVDRIFDASEAVLVDKKVVSMGQWAVRPKFADEWQWNDHYAELAKQWIVAHPQEALLFTLKKTWAVFGDVQPVPRKAYAVAEVEPYYGKVGRAGGIGWMIIARLLFVAFCVGVIFEVRSTRTWSALWLLFLMAAYSIPYAVVFASQRHVVPMLVYTGLSFAGILYRLRQPTRELGLQTIEGNRAASVARA